MKAVVFIIALVGIVGAYEPINIQYHRDIGIPLATRVKQAEEARNFDGSRIVGGSYAAIGQFPYQAGLVIHVFNGQTSLCGASLLTHTRLVTAAHCWTDGGLYAVQFDVVLGSTTLFYGGTRIPTSDVFVHPGYNPYTVKNDIAIIAIPWVNYNSIIQPINLPTAYEAQSFAGWWAQASGFGLTADGAGISTNQVLKNISVQIITNAACATTYGPDVVINSTLCTSGAGYVNTCTGDSGGPIAVTTGGQNVLVGVVSFGSWRGCEAAQPAGHARVTSFLPWIQSYL